LDFRKISTSTFSKYVFDYKTHIKRYILNSLKFLNTIYRLCEMILISFNLKLQLKLGASAHTCNPSYPGGRDQEDRGLKPGWANSLWDTILKNPSQK
jgi:hypothetical protein